MFTTDQLLLIAALSVVVAGCPLVAKLAGRVKLGWSWVLAVAVTILAAGGFALWVAAQISAAI